MRDKATEHLYFCFSLTKTTEHPKFHGFYNRQRQAKACASSRICVQVPVWSTQKLMAKQKECGLSMEGACEKRLVKQAGGHGKRSREQKKKGTKQSAPHQRALSRSLSSKKETRTEANGLLYLCLAPPKPHTSCYGLAFIPLFAFWLAFCRARLAKKCPSTCLMPCCRLRLASGIIADGPHSKCVPRLDVS